MRNLRLAILGSTRGTDMLAVIAAIKNDALPASIEIVISDKKQALILKRATQHGLNTCTLDPQGLSREEFDRKLSAVLLAQDIDLILLIGFMRILSPSFVNQWKNRIINVHPSLLPAFGGGMDQNVHQAVLDAGVKETGCTVHWVTKDLDQGPILVQKICAVLPQDTVESLKDRVQLLEGQALIEAVTLIHEQQPIYSRG